MNLQTYSKQMIHIFENNKDLLEYFKELSTHHSEIAINPERIFTIRTEAPFMGNDVNTIKNQLNKHKDFAMEVIRKKRPHDIIKMISSFIDDLINFDDTFSDSNNFKNDLESFIEKHTDAYSDKTFSHIYSATELSLRLHQSISDFNERFELMNKKNEKFKMTIPASHGLLSINSDQKTYFISEFSTIFTSIESLYEYICYIHKIDPKDINNKLLIDDIHTGSWTTDLLGVKEVVLAIENLFKGIGGFLRDLITGQIAKEQFLNKCEEASAYIDLIKKAKEIGIDNPEVGLQKCLKPFGEIAQNGMTLLEINGEDVLNLTAYDKLIIDGKRMDQKNFIESKIQIAKKNED